MDVIISLLLSEFKNMTQTGLTYNENTIRFSNAPLSKDYAVQI